MGLVLVGCGKMGGAMLEGWLDQGIDKTTIRIVEQSVDYGQALEARLGVRVVTSIEDIEETFKADIVLLAVKPQGMDQAAQSCKRFGTGTTFMSIAAGKTISYFENFFGADASIIRVMPNTPAAVRRGISVACANPNVSQMRKDECTSLLEAIGEVAWVQDEALMDPVTALSGSGPAYVFYMTECMARAGVASGLSEELALQLARATVAGAGELMRQSDLEVDVLRKNVTSPGGTTEAALNVLMDEKGLAPLMDKALAAATRRSKELAG
jgi:pyrroline-5-carboxylate reductase